MQENATFSIRPLNRVTDFDEFRDQVDILSVESEKPSPYITGFATYRKSVEAVLRLRYEIFNIELGEGLSSSQETGLDEDRFDSQMTQLILLEKDSQKVVGTYRMQTIEQAFASREGSYSGQEYDLEPLRPYFKIATECGRACLSIEHRKMKALIKLWHGIGTFMNLYNQKYLFGCCSLSSTNPADGWRALGFLKKNGNLHPKLLLPATQEYVCEKPDSPLSDVEFDSCHIPKLFKIYLRLGANVISEPALDLNFKTIDFLVLLNAPEVSMSSLNVFQ